MKITNKITIDKYHYDQVQSLVGDVASLKKAIEKSLTKDITWLLETILVGAIALDASDVHFEPEEKLVKMRLRIDGFLRDILPIKPAIYQALLSRVKLLSEIKLNIASRAQDGRFSALLSRTPVEIRVATLPSEYGESIVMRVLAGKNILRLEDLGVRDDIMTAFNQEITRPYGLIIITGPTGSGKTTTLYAILQKIKNPGIKIITIEDPIEYHLPGISQTQIDTSRGYDFANGLQAIVRQDPDIILVGEIRDSETAKISIQAALTGHLVLATLHANNAAGTIARLQALGETATNIAPALNIIIAQRLVRKICLECRQFSPVTAEELKKIKANLDNLPEHIQKNTLDANLKIPRPKGCQKCGDNGYKGRLGAFEFLLANEEMKNFILKSPSIVDLEKKAIEKGSLTMRQDGLLKVLSGVTTLEEIERETGAL